MKLKKLRAGALLSLSSHAACIYVFLGPMLSNPKIVVLAVARHLQSRDSETTTCFGLCSPNIALPQFCVASALFLKLLDADPMAPITVAQRSYTCARADFHMLIVHARGVTQPAQPLWRERKVHTGAKKAQLPFGLTMPKKVKQKTVKLEANKLEADASGRRHAATTEDSSSSSDSSDKDPVVDPPLQRVITQNLRRFN